MVVCIGPRAGRPAAELVCVLPRTACEMSVVIPVRDEAANLPGTLRALASQFDLAGNPLDRDRYEVILLVNNSVDASADVARAYRFCNPNLVLHVVEVNFPADDAHVGNARRLLMDAAAARLPAGGMIATTDADTIVAPDWIAATLAEVAAGADAVGGRILVDPAGFAEHGPHARLYHLRDVTYRYLVTELESLLAPDPFDPWPRHFQHFGASLAVTVEAYRRAGGIPPLPSLEDVALYDALRRSGARIRHSPTVRVTTSSRPSDRTGFGFAVQLGRWAAMGARREPMLVEPLESILARLRDCRDVDDSPADHPLEPVEDVIHDLRTYLSRLRSAADGLVRTLEQVEPVRLMAAAD